MASHVCESTCMNVFVQGVCMFILSTSKNWTSHISLMTFFDSSFSALYISFNHVTHSFSCFDFYIFAASYNFFLLQCLSSSTGISFISCYQSNHHLSAVSYRKQKMHHAQNWKWGSVLKPNPLWKIFSQPLKNKLSPYILYLRGNVNELIEWASVCVYVFL